MQVLTSLKFKLLQILQKFIVINLHTQIVTTFKKIV